MMMTGSGVTVQLVVGDVSVAISHEEASGSPEFTDTLLGMATRHALKANLALQGLIGAGEVDDDAVEATLTGVLEATESADGIKTILASSGLVDGVEAGEGEDDVAA